MSLDAEQRRWLEGHSLEELQHEFKRASLKRGGRSGRSSQYRGVSAHRGKWQARLKLTIGGMKTYVLRAFFGLEADAVYAYNCAAVQWLGRCTTYMPLQFMLSI